MKKIYKTLKSQVRNDKVSNSGKRKTKLEGLKRATSLDILEACDSADEREVDLLLSNGHGINDIYVGTTLLNRAVTNEKISLIRYLLRNGSDVDKTVNGINPIHKSIMQNNQKIFEILMDRQPDINKPIPNGNTPLHLSAQKGSLQMTRQLAHAGADITLKNRHGDTSLHLAAKSGNHEIFRFLVENGASLSVVNRDGKTALDLASTQRGHEGDLFIEWLS